MEQIDVFFERRSVRSYNGKPVPTELVDKIIEAGLYAPSALGKQKTIIIEISDKKTRDELSALNASIAEIERDPFYGAPTVLLVASENTPTAVCDGSCVIDNMLNAAYALGVSSCWIHRADEELKSEYGINLLKRLGIEGDYVGVGHVILGYTDEEIPEAKPRREGRVFKI